MTGMLTLQIVRLEDRQKIWTIILCKLKLFKSKANTIKRVLLAEAQHRRLHSTFG